MSDKSWQICEVQYVLDHRKIMTYAQMGICLDRSTYSIEGMISVLGVGKPMLRKPKKDRLRFSDRIRDWLLGEVTRC